MNTKALMDARWLALPHSLEALYWSSADTIDRLQSQDALGLCFGITVHLLIAYLKTTWHAYARALTVMAGMMQLAQVGGCLAQPADARARARAHAHRATCCPRRPPQLYWALHDKAGYARHRAKISVLQRLRWLVNVTAIIVSCRSTQELLHPLQWHADGSTGTWRELLMVLGVFAFPAMFTAMLVHTVPFQLQLLLLGPLSVLQHLVFGLPHQLHAVGALGLRPHVAKACGVMYVLLDPSVLAYGPASGPAHCTGERPGFFLVYTYALLAGLLPAQLVHWSEYGHKRAFLRARRAEGSAQARAAWEASARARDGGRPALAALARLWAACAICWSLASLLYALAPSVPPLDALLAASAPGG
jgi:hypothetical protein